MCYTKAVPREAPLAANGRLFMPGAVRHKNSNNSLAVKAVVASQSHPTTHSSIAGPGMSVKKMWRPRASPMDGWDAISGCGPFDGMLGTSS